MDPILSSGCERGSVADGQEPCSVSFGSPAVWSGASGAARDREPAASPAERRSRQGSAHKQGRIPGTASHDGKDHDGNRPPPQASLR